jgi:low temperature requirement protein LtrA
LAAVPAVRREKSARRALVAASVGLGLLALMELVAMSAATTANDSTLGTISSLYGVPILMIGVGLIVAGVILLRRHALGRRLPWTLLALGGFVFLVLGPALASDSFVAGRWAIMAWMLLFAVLGALMQRADDDLT